MKTYSATIRRGSRSRFNPVFRLLPDMAVSGADILAVLGAVSAASLVILLSVLAAGIEATGILGAANWGLGLVFIALALDKDSPFPVLRFLTGLAMCVLAWLQFSVSPDFIVATGVLLAAWLAAALFRHLR